VVRGPALLLLLARLNLIEVWLGLHRHLSILLSLHHLGLLARCDLAGVLLLGPGPVLAEVDVGEILLGGDH